MGLHFETEHLVTECFFCPLSSLNTFLFPSVLTCCLTETHCETFSSAHLRVSAGTKLEYGHVFCLHRVCLEDSVCNRRMSNSVSLCTFLHVFVLLFFLLSFKQFFPAPPLIVTMSPKQCHMHSLLFHIRMRSMGGIIISIFAFLANGSRLDIFDLVEQVGGTCTKISGTSSLSPSSLDSRSKANAKPALI